MKRTIPTIATVAAAIGVGLGALTGAGVAGADEQSYLDQVNGLPWPIHTDAKLLKTGVAVCVWMREGQSPQQVVDRMNHEGTQITPWEPVVNAAQHDLCPDTLR